MNLAVYTAILGGRDAFNHPTPIRDGWDFHLYTDEEQPWSPTAFVHRVTVPPTADPRRASRKFKQLPHVCLPEYDATLWLDGSMRLKTGNLRPFVERYLRDRSIAVFPHRYCKCAYAAAREVCEAGIVDLDTCVAQMERYRAAGYPENHGMAECGIILRRNCPDANAFNELWFSEVREGSKRDQLSFDYVSWALGIPYALMEGDVMNNELCEFVGHR